MDTLSHMAHTMRVQYEAGSLPKEEYDRFASFVESALDVLAHMSEGATDPAPVEVQENHRADGSSSAHPLGVFKTWRTWTAKLQCRAHFFYWMDGSTVHFPARAPENVRVKIQIRVVSHTTQPQKEKKKSNLCYLILKYIRFSYLAFFHHYLRRPEQGSLSKKKRSDQAVEPAQ